MSLRFTIGASIVVSVLGAQNCLLHGSGDGTVSGVSAALGQQYNAVFGIDAANGVAIRFGGFSVATSAFGQAFVAQGPDSVMFTEWQANPQFCQSQPIAALPPSFCVGQGTNFPDVGASITYGTVAATMWEGGGEAWVLLNKDMAVTGGGHIYSNGQFIEWVIVNQTATAPPASFFSLPSYCSTEAAAAMRAAVEK